MRTIKYAGRVVAVTTRRRVFLMPRMEALPRGHPVLRFVATKCLYSRAVDLGRVGGPYSDAHADAYVRRELMPEAEFRARAHESHAALSARFGVPVEQARTRRTELSG